MRNTTNPSCSLNIYLGHKAKGIMTLPASIGQCEKTGRSLGLPCSTRQEYLLLSQLHWVHNKHIPDNLVAYTYSRARSAATSLGLTWHKHEEDFQWLDCRKAFAFASLQERILQMLLSSYPVSQHSVRCVKQTFCFPDSGDTQEKMGVPS